MLFTFASLNISCRFFSLETSSHFKANYSSFSLTLKTLPNPPAPNLFNTFMSFINSIINYVSFIIKKMFLFNKTYPLFKKKLNLPKYCSKMKDKNAALRNFEKKFTCCVKRLCGVEGIIGVKKICDIKYCSVRRICDVKCCNVKRNLRRKKNLRRT